MVFPEPNEELPIPDDFSEKLMRNAGFLISFPGISLGMPDGSLALLAYREKRRLIVSFGGFQSENVD